MSIGRDEVAHVARLAELAVNDAELPKLAEQMNRIVDYVARLDEVPVEEVRPFHAGPPAVALRADEVRPWPMTRGPETMAPEFQDGLFLVPGRGTLED